MKPIVTILTSLLLLLPVTLQASDMAKPTIVIFLADNGTDSGLVHSWGNGKSIAGAKAA